VPGKIIIETSRLLIREYFTDDIAMLHKILSDPITMCFWPEPFTVDQTNAWVERSMTSYAENGFGRFAVLLKQTGELIGDAGILKSEINGKIENDLGYIIYHPFWNNGYATEAAEAILRRGLDSIGLRRIAANIAFDNIPSQRIAEKIGMKKESEFKNKRNRNILTFLYLYKI
jgi:[ribosomal protein S5]-alanine N-acetyltransferase